ncbi:MAG: hypothetical protein IPG96_15185 [Proteobacteria bacterium]|nr:hypothetical protein [Pseudomonadota bacterium]
MLVAAFGASLVPAGAAARAAAAPQRAQGQSGVMGSALFGAFMGFNGGRQVTATVRVPKPGRLARASRRVSGGRTGYQTQHVTTTLRRAHAANLAAAAPGWSGAHSTGIRVTAGLAAATLGVAGGLMAVSGWVQLSWAALSVAALFDLYRQVAAVRAAAPEFSLWAAAKAVLGTVTHAFAPAPAEVDRARAATLQIADQNQIGVWGALAERFGLQRAAP